MIKFRLRELMADRSSTDGRLVTMEEVARGTGIHRSTLYKIASGQPYNATTDNLHLLCKFFGCSLQDIAEYVPDSDPPIDS